EHWHLLEMFLQLAGVPILSHRTLAIILDPISKRRFREDLLRQRRRLFITQVTNQSLRDHKSFPALRCELSEKIPALLLIRQVCADALHLANRSFSLEFGVLVI